MNREIEQVILAQGYRFCTVQPENVGVFYKYYQQGFHVVMMISLDDTKTLTIEQLHIRDSIHQKPAHTVTAFIDSYGMSAVI